MKTKKQTKKEKKDTVLEPTHKNEDVLKNLYQKEGKSAGQIARMFNVSRAAVLFQMRKHNIPITTRKTKSADAKENYKDAKWLQAQIKKGVSIFKIAKNQGVSYTTVYYFAKTLLGDARKIEVNKKK